MAQKIVDISKYINNDAPQMVLFGKTYTIKNDKNTVLALADLQRSDSNTDEQIINLLVGEENAKEILKIVNNNPNYNENTKAIMLNIMALATGVTYEELEARFRKVTQ